MTLVFLSRHCRGEREKPEAAEGGKSLSVWVGQIAGEGIDSSDGEFTDDE